MINKFSGDYSFLSNFFPSKIEYDGDEYSSVEHAFQAAKTLNPKERDRIRKASFPSIAKQIGRTVTLRQSWEEIKVEIMYQLLKKKFSNITLIEKLLDTKDEKLVEGNDWHDYFWGVCNGKGENHLGKLLMRVREELREKERSQKMKNIKSQIFIEVDIDNNMKIFTNDLDGCLEITIRALNEMLAGKYEGVAGMNLRILSPEEAYPRK